MVIVLHSGSFSVPFVSKLLSLSVQPRKVSFFAGSSASSMSSVPAGAETEVLPSIVPRMMLRVYSVSFSTTGPSGIRKLTVVLSSSPFG